MSDIVRLKPLEWEKITDRFFKATTIFGQYELRRSLIGEWYFCLFRDDIQKQCGSFDAAKSAAWGHYCAKMLEAFRVE